jgi:hypothetical protein
MTKKYVSGPSYFVRALATKKVQTCRKVDKSLTMGQESTFLIVLLEIAISELKNQYANSSFTLIYLFWLKTYALHCGGFHLYLSELVFINQFYSIMTRGSFICTFWYSLSSTSSIL